MFKPPNFKREMKRMGVPGLAGIALLVFSAVFYFSALQPTRQQLDAARKEHASWQTHLNKHENLPRSVELQLSEFYGAFPAGDKETEILASIYAAAAHNNLALETGEYKRLTDNSQKLVRYQAIFPIKGSYIQIRQFMDDVLTALPSVSLDDVSFKRESIGSGTLDARVKLTLFMLKNR
jgi:Tfp pilus assembly protein PilO